MTALEMIVGLTSGTITFVALRMLFNKLLPNNTWNFEMLKKLKEESKND